MKIALINGSPKIKNSASEYILKTLKTLLQNEHEIIEYHFRTSKLNNDNLVEISECNAIVLAFPLYVDGIPSHLVNCLYQMQIFLKSKLIKKITVFSIVNCGFYEGHQNSIAIKMIENWCQKSKICWGRGIGIGGGGMLSMLTGVPDGKGPKKNLYLALKTITKSISDDEIGDNIFISPNFPRFAYKIGAEIGWNQQIKSNGLKRKDLFIKK